MPEQGLVTEINVREPALPCTWARGRAPAELNGRAPVPKIRLITAARDVIPSGSFPQISWRMELLFL